MGLLAKLRAKFGREPSDDEIAAAKAERAAKKATAEAAAAVAASPPTATPAKIKLEVLRSRIDVPAATESNPEPKGALVVSDGVGSTANCLLSLTGTVPDKTIADIRRVAAGAFGDANGWQIYLGAKASNAVFIGGEDGGVQSFNDEFEILMMDKVFKPKAFAVECRKGSEGRRSSRPMQQPTGVKVQASKEMLQDIVDEAVGGIESAAKGRASQKGGMCPWALRLSHSPPPLLLSTLSSLSSLSFSLPPLALSPLSPLSSFTSFRHLLLTGGEATKSKGDVASAGKGKMIKNLQTEVQKRIDQTLSNKYSVPGSKPVRPAFAITTNKWDKPKGAYIKFNASDVSQDMLCVGIKGPAKDQQTLTSETLWVCCLLDGCEKKDKSGLEPRPWRKQLQVKDFNKRGELRLASLESLVDAHIVNEHGGAIPAENAEAAIRAAQKKSERQSGVIANKLGFVAAVAQATPPKAKTTSPATGSVNRGSGLSALSAIDADLMPENGEYVMLMLPMDAPAKGFEGQRRSKLFASEYVNVQTEGTVVCDDTFDLLRRIEMARSVCMNAGQLTALQRRAREPFCERLCGVRALA
jgi:hypothetical protein